MFGGTTSLLRVPNRASFNDEWGHANQICNIIDQPCRRATRSDPMFDRPNIILTRRRRMLQRCGCLIIGQDKISTVTSVLKNFRTKIKLNNSEGLYINEHEGNHVIGVCVPAWEHPKPHPRSCCFLFSLPFLQSVVYNMEDRLLQCVQKVYVQLEHN
jgi:hypothetical protein